MADINNLTNFLSDVADAIRTKKGTEAKIPAENFDEEILQLSGGDIKQFVTEEEMNADTTATEGDLAVVYSSTISNITADSQFQTAKVPSTVVLPEAVTSYIDIRFKKVDSSQWFNCWGMLDSSMFTMDCNSGAGSVRIEYTSSDGITYTRTDGGEESVDFGLIIQFSGTWNDAIGYFIQIGNNYFGGLFEYNENSWSLAPTQLNATALNLLPGKTAYSNNGIITGSDNFFDQSFTVEQVAKVAGIDIENQSSYPVYVSSGATDKLMKVVQSNTDVYNLPNKYLISELKPSDVYGDTSLTASVSVSNRFRGIGYDFYWFVSTYSDNTALFFCKGKNIVIGKLVTLPISTIKYIDLFLYKDTLYAFITSTDTAAYLYKVNENGTFTQIGSDITASSGRYIRFLGMQGDYVYYRIVNGGQYCNLNRANISTGAASQLFSWYSDGAEMHEANQPVRFIFPDRTFYIKTDYGSGIVGDWTDFAIIETTNTGSAYKYSIGYPEHNMTQCPYSFIAKENGNYYVYLNSSNNSASGTKVKYQLNNGTLGSKTTHTKITSMSIGTGIASNPAYIINDGSDYYVDMWYSTIYSRRYNFLDGTYKNTPFWPYSTTSDCPTYFDGMLLQPVASYKRVYAIPLSICEITDITSDLPGDILTKSLTSSTKSLTNSGYCYPYINLSDCLPKINEQANSIEQLETNYEECLSISNEILGGAV